MVVYNRAGYIDWNFYLALHPLEVYFSIRLLGAWHRFYFSWHFNNISFGIYPDKN